MEQDIPDPRVRIVSREKWGALPPKLVEPLTLPAHRLFFMHTDTPRCMNREACYKELKELQKSYMDQGMPDLPFSFLIGGDLRIYEGRGWGVRIRRRDLWEWNDDRVVIALISPQRVKVDDKHANKMMWKAYALMDEGVEKNKLVDFDKHRFHVVENIANEREMMKREYRKMKKEQEEEEKRKQKVSEHFEKEQCEGQYKEETEKEKEDREIRERKEKEIREKELEAQKRNEKEKQKKRREDRDHPLTPRRKVTIKDLFRAFLEERKKKAQEKKERQRQGNGKEKEKDNDTETKN